MLGKKSSFDQYSLKSLFTCIWFLCCLGNISLVKAVDFNSTVQVVAPKIVFVASGADGEFSSAAEAFAAASAKFNYNTIIGGQTYSRSASNLHVFRPDYYQSYNGTPSMYASDSTTCAYGECTFTADGGPVVTAPAPLCPEDVVKQGDSEYRFILTDTTVDQTSKAREFKCIQFPKMNHLKIAMQSETLYFLLPVKKFK